jgi:hypothetical protein
MGVFEKENEKDILGHGYKHKRSFIEEEIWKNLLAFIGIAFDFVPI